MAAIGDMATIPHNSSHDPEFPGVQFQNELTDRANVKVSAVKDGDTAFRDVPAIGQDATGAAFGMLDTDGNVRDTQRVPRSCTIHVTAKILGFLIQLLCNQTAFSHIEFQVLMKISHQSSPSRIRGHG